MEVCASCEAIVLHKRGEPGHDSLIKLGEVRAHANVSRGARQVAYTCGVCGTDWDHLHDKNDPNAGWSRS